MIASMLRKEHDVSIYDAEYFAHTPTSLAIHLKTLNPDIVGFTGTILTYHGMTESAEAVRRVLPHVKILLGGPLVTSMSDEELHEKFTFDLCVKGECEKNILEIINSDARGIVQGEHFEDLSKIPRPSRDLLCPSYLEYEGNSPHFEKPETPVLWSRGCPHRCIFCSNPVFGRRAIRYRPPQDIVDELQNLVDAGIRSVFVYDDEVIGMNEAQSKWIEEVCDLIIKRGINEKLTFKAQARCNPKVVSEALLRKMYRAGFKAIMWGIESGSPRVLKSIKKGISPEDVKTIFKRSKRAGIKNFGFFMVGNYGETHEDILLTKDLIDEIQPNWVQVTCAVPLKPAEFFELNRHNFDEDALNNVYFQYSFCGTDTLSRKEIQTWYLRFDRMYQRRLNLKNNLPRYISETLFTMDGIKRLPYRVQKYLKLKKEGAI